MYLRTKIMGYFLWRASLGLLPVLGMLSWGALAVPNDGKGVLNSNTGEQLVANIEEERSIFRATLIQSFYPRLRPSLPAHSLFTFSLGYSPWKQHRFELVQRASYNFEVMVQESPFKLGDLELAYLYTILPSKMGFALGGRFSVTAPTSMKSYRKGLLSRPKFELRASRSFWDDLLVINWKPYMRYHWNKFTTNADGLPLPKWELGHSLSVLVSPIKGLHLSAEFIAYWVWKTQTRYMPYYGPRQMNYGFVLSADYAVTDMVSLFVGFEQVDAFTKEGYTEMNFYDPKQSRFFVGFALQI